MSSDLPPGCTTQDCEGGPEQFCANCGHSRSEFHDNTDIEACDYQTRNSLNEPIPCDCPGYVEGEFEPEIDEDRMKGHD